MNGVYITKQVEITLTAEDWDLYTHGNAKACEEAAHEINAVIETEFNAGTNRRALHKAVGAVMHKYADLGAEDSEPVWKLEAVLDKLYGKGF